MLAVLVIVTAIVFGACSGDSEADATATESSTLAPSTAPVSTESATSEPEQTVDELLADIERRVEKFRGIDTPPPLEHSFVDKSFMRELLAEQLADPETVEQLVHESALLKLLGVIPQDSDLGAIYESMFGSRVLGLYDPEKEQFFVLDDSGLGPDSPANGLDTEGQLTYAHEYVHRLQDAEFDLEFIDEEASGDDMRLAIAAVVEGDATNAQAQYMFQNFTFLELANLMDSILRDQADIPDAPAFLQRALEFPYLEGAAFVAEVVKSGGISAIDDVFNDLPLSTEQIMHFGKYVNAEEPDELEIPDDALGSDWEVQADNILGEFFLKTWLETLVSEEAEAAAADWGGDAYTVFENDADEIALGVLISWDTDDDAREFIVALSEAFTANENYLSRSNGLPGVLEAWEGPGGYIVLSRWNADDEGDRVAISITPNGADSHRLNFSLAGTESE